MLKEWADKWVEALRSGKYKQGVCSLRGENDTFCCLGVLEDIVAIHVPELKGPAYLYDGHKDFLTPETQSLVGMKDDRGRLVEEKEYFTLAIANDNGISFLGIADIIEKNWRHL